MEMGLCSILAITFVAPFVHRKIEHHLELFLLIMGVSALTISGGWSEPMVLEALREPIPISLVVLVAGYLFKYTRPYLHTTLQYLFRYMSQSLFLFLMIFLLGLLSSMITAIIAALVLVEIITVLQLSKQTETKITILACYAIGLGAALTPIGEPLSTIVNSKLDQDFWFLFRNFSLYIVPALFGLSLWAVWFHGKTVSFQQKELSTDSHQDVLFRAVKVFIFVMALIFLGAGFQPLIHAYILPLPSIALYWLNMVSAILDNATLAAAEISPELTSLQLKSILMALLISGGMLIPGNIPNIIAAQKLKIKTKEWASFGVPVGLVLMMIYFLILEVL
ncbi:MAG: DUF1646 family protein [Deltaproteobacteria bacterium]|nr:DUF1646 family protein [Deltaproteobacteria bacterium]